MADAMTGVFPVYENQFQVGLQGRDSAVSGDFVPIADMESFSVSFDDTVQEWTPFTTAGWIRRLKTGKSIKITVAGKRNVGDAGNDYVAGMAMMSGQDCNTILRWTFPDGTKFNIPVVINVTALGTGGSTDVGPLEFEALSDGQPTTGEG